MSIRCLVTWIVGAAMVAAQPVVSNVTVSEITDHTAAISWSNSVQWNDGTEPNGGSCRVRYGTDTTYEATPLGGIQELGTYSIHSEYGVYDKVFGCKMNLYNLKPSTTYHVCPQTAIDGSTWTVACVDASFTTLAAQSYIPVAPTRFSTAYPDTTSYTKVTVSSSDCDDATTGLQALIDAAAVRRGTSGTGTVITIPKTLVCSSQYYLQPDGGGAVKSIGGVNVTNNTLILANHGFAANQAVRLAALAGTACTRGVWAAACTPFGRWAVLPGITYYIKLVDLGTFQLAATPGGAAIDFGIGVVTNVNTGTGLITVDKDGAGMRTGDPVEFRGANLPAPLAQSTTYCVSNPSAALRAFSLTTWPGCSTPVTLTTTGSGLIETAYPGGNVMGIQAWPPSSAEIIIQSDSTALPPSGIRLTSAYSAELASFVQTAADALVHPSFSTNALAHHYRIGPGLNITVASTSSLNTLTTDPGSYFFSVLTTPESHHIILDRVLIGPPDAYTRQMSAISWSGSEQAIINSSFVRMNYWHPGNRIGMASTLGTNAVTWTAGSITAGPNTFTFPGSVTANFSGGSVTGNGCAWFNLATSQLVLDLPTGVSVSSLTGYADYAVQNHASPTCGINGAWPQYLGRDYSVQPFAQFSWTAGTLTAKFDTFEQSTVNSEGTQMINAGLGPGPYEYSNNYASNTGIAIHHDDSACYYNYTTSTSSNGLFCSPQVPRDIYVANSFWTNDAHTIFGRTGSDGNRYYNRNAFEVKNGARGQLVNNWFERGFADTAFLGTQIVIQSQRGNQTTDWEVAYNRITNCATGPLLMGAIPKRSPVGIAGQRYYIHDNVVDKLDGTLHTSTTGDVTPNAFSAAYGGTGWALIHNTVPDTASSANGIIHYVKRGWAGTVILNNYFALGTVLANEEDSACSGLGTDKALMDCINASGTDVGYTYSGNITKGYSTSMTPNTSLGSASPGFVDSVNGNYVPLLSSPLKGTATDSTDVGVNWQSWRAAWDLSAAKASGVKFQGKVQ